MNESTTCTLRQTNRDRNFKFTTFQKEKHDLNTVPKRLTPNPQKGWWQLGSIFSMKNLNFHRFLLPNPSTNTMNQHLSQGLSVGVQGAIVEARPIVLGTDRSWGRWKTQRLGKLRREEVTTVVRKTRQKNSKHQRHQILPILRWGSDSGINRRGSLLLVHVDIPLSYGHSPVSLGFLHTGTSVETSTRQGFLHIHVFWPELTHVCTFWRNSRSLLYTWKLQDFLDSFVLLFKLDIKWSNSDETIGCVFSVDLLKIPAVKSCLKGWKKMKFQVNACKVMKV